MRIVSESLWLVVGQDIYQNISRVGIDGGRTWLRAKRSLENMLKHHRMERI
jgi:hypothetical protein